MLHAESLKKESSSKKKGPYENLPPNSKQRLRGTYAIENGNCAAAHKFSVPLDKPINEIANYK